MNVYRLAGVACGVVIGLLLCFIAYRKANTDGKLRTDYDERQQAIRGKSYKIGFYTYMILMALMTVISMSDVELPMENSVTYFVLLFLGAVPTCIHTVLNDAYWGLNNNKKKYIILLALCTVVNLGVSLGAFIDGRMIVDGKLSTPFINFVCGIMILIIAVTAIAKSAYDKKIESEE